MQKVLPYITAYEHKMYKVKQRLKGTLTLGSELVGIPYIIVT